VSWTARVLVTFGGVVAGAFLGWFVGVGIAVAAEGECRGMVDCTDGFVWIVGGLLVGPIAGGVIAWRLTRRFGESDEADRSS